MFSSNYNYFSVSQKYRFFIFFNKESGTRKEEKKTLKKFKIKDPSISINFKMIARSIKILALSVYKAESKILKEWYYFSNNW